MPWFRGSGYYSDSSSSENSSTAVLAKRSFTPNFERSELKSIPWKNGCFIRAVISCVVPGAPKRSFGSSLTSLSIKSLQVGSMLSGQEIYLFDIRGETWNSCFPGIIILPVAILNTIQPSAQRSDSSTVEQLPIVSGAI